MQDGDGRNQERESPQPTGLDPIAQALRTTYDAENHDSLGSDLTGLMLELARVDPAKLDEQAARAQGAAAPGLPPAPSHSWVRRIIERLGVSADGRREAG